MAINYVMSLPNFRFMMLFIYSGLPWDKYFLWCQYWSFGYFNQESYDAIVVDEMKNKVIAKMITFNRQCFKSKNKIRIIKKVRSRFMFPEVLEQIVDGLSQAATIKDPSKSEMPEALIYFLRNHRMRMFIESGLLVGLSFYEINRFWKQFNSVRILREHFEIYNYFLWDTSSMTSPELRYFFLRNVMNQFYGTHHKVFSKDVNHFLGYWGLQNQAMQNESIDKIALKTLKKILAASEEPPKELFSLLNFCSTQIARSNKKQSSVQTTMKQNSGYSDPSMLTEPNTAAAEEVRNSNREYRFKQLLDFNMKMEEKNHV